MREKTSGVKATLKKVSDIFKLIFGYGIMIVLFAGGLTFFGYAAALIVGGETATAMCTWIYKTFIPIIIKASTILILFGLVTMYLAGEKALTPGRKPKNKREKKGSSTKVVEKYVYIPHLRYSAETEQEI